MIDDAEINSFKTTVASQTYWYNHTHRNLRTVGSVGGMGYRFVKPGAK